MIISNQEVAVHLGCLRNLTSYTSGRYALRVSLSQENPEGGITATPVSIIQRDPVPCGNQPQCDQQHATSRIFPLKSGADVDIDEIYIFKLDSPLTSIDQSQLKLRIDLYVIESDRERMVSSYTASINGQAQHQYLEIDFYEVAPCQIRGSFHRCQYKFEFKNGETGMSLLSFCEKYYQNKSNELLEYLKGHSRKNYHSLAEYSSLALGEEVEIDCVEMQESIMSKINESQIDSWEGQTEIGEAEQELSFQISTMKRRKRIFSTAKDYLNEKYQSHQKNFHDQAQKIYSLWQDLLPKLFTNSAYSYLRGQAHIYRKKIIDKTLESVSSFKGSWDIDMFGEETHLRKQLSDQLRKRDSENTVQQTPFAKSEFPILNDKFFSQKKPVFFQEKSCRPTHIQEPLAQEVLVILVHGLGACRMDMEKIKVELKRYYEGKVRIYSSSCNEGRTEGNIEAMGMRLASQIDYELNKYATLPKISLVGHSMGGLIIRSALPRLQKYKKHFHSFVTLSSPHLGYSYSDSRLIDAGLWFMNTVKKCTSLIQMSMKDHQNVQQTFLYKLSEKPGLEWFKKVSFLGSHDDHYVPYYSARIQKHEESLQHQRDNVKKGKVHCQMVDKILSKVKGSITRVDVNFCILQQNLDNFIGRAAHISFINDVEMIRTLILVGKHYFF